MKIQNLLRGAVVAASFVGASLSASATTMNFNIYGYMTPNPAPQVGFFDTSSPDYGVLASGSFSFANGTPNGTLLSYSDLTSFSMMGVAPAALGFSITLADINAMVNTPNRYFGYTVGDTQFTPGAHTGSFGSTTSMMVARDPTPDRGFWLDSRLPTDPIGAPGGFQFNKFGTPGVNQEVIFHWHTADITLAPIPEPSAIALSLAGLGVLGFMSRRRRSNQAV